MEREKEKKDVMLHPGTNRRKKKKTETIFCELAVGKRGGEVRS